MVEQRKKKRSNNNKTSSKSFKKSLRQSTHPVASEKVEPDSKKYDRKHSKKEAQQNIERDLND
jgi:hypothetical protein|tara:strand:- start:659 stop:847 length:189 start_codon:yes stop_codon:yes gene_type:complete